MIKISQSILIAFVPALLMEACTTTPKCPTADLTNPVFEKGSCLVKTRNVYVGDLMSPELKGKFQDPTTSVHWVGPANSNGIMTPGHFVITTGDHK